MKISYYEYNEEGQLAPVYEKDAQKTGRFIFKDDIMIRIGEGRRGPTHYAASDNLGVQGVFNPADGKTYDSRSAYYNAVKNKGLEIVGDQPQEPKTPKTKPINWEKAVSETLQQLPPPKRKRK